MSTALGLSHGGQSYRNIQKTAQQLDLSLEHFRGQGWNKGTGNGRDPVSQRAAKKRWYDDNRDVYMARNVRRRVELVKTLREQKDGPCLDCGQRFPYFVMEFDHREGETKEFDVGSGVRRGVGIQRLLREIEKCDLVCVICHRFRTARRAGWDGVDGGPSNLALLADDS